MYEQNPHGKVPSDRSKRHPKPISGVIGKVIASLGLSGSYNGWQVVNKWPEIVGNAIARKATAVRWEDGCLFVEVRDASWRQELAMKQDELLEKIHSLPYGRSVKEIRLVRGMKGPE
jgi:hypothetical protein